MTLPQSQSEASSPADSTSLRRQIPGFEMLGLLGRGGMGVVYKARHTALNRLVAIKMIRAAEDAGAEDRLRFKIEAETVARLHHPHIVQLFQIGEVDGLPYLAFEYVEGGSLADRIDGVPQPIKESVVLVETLARAVHAAHRHGIVHRDLKPANVLLTTDGIPKVADFGMACQQERADLSVSGTIQGTPAYMAPEQAWGSTRLTTTGPAVDVYALGAILYELLTGQPPFQANSSRETLEKVWSQAPTPPCELRPEVPADVQTICLRCLHKDPHKRYAGAEALADDLRRFNRREPIQARPIGRLERVWLWGRRKPLEAALAAGLAVSLVTGIAGIGAKWYEAHQNWQLAQTNLKRATDAETVAKDAAARAKRERDAALDNLYAFLVLGAARALADDNRTQAEEYLDRCPIHQRNVEWELLQRQALGSNLTFSGHDGEVTSVAVSGNGERIATSSTSGPVRLWNARDGKLIAKLAGPAKRVEFASGGDKLLVLTHNSLSSGELQLWDVTKKKLLKTLSRAVECFSLSVDGTRLAVGYAFAVVEVLTFPEGKSQSIIDLTTLLARQPEPDGTPPGELPAVAPKPDFPGLTAIQRELRRLQGIRNGLQHRETGQLWLLQDRPVAVTWANTMRLAIAVRQPVGSRDGLRVPTQTRYQLLVWNGETNPDMPEFTFSLPEDVAVGDMAVSADDSVLYAGVSNRGFDELADGTQAYSPWKVLRFDLRTGTTLESLRPETVPLNYPSFSVYDVPDLPRLSFSDDGRQLAVSLGRRVAVIDLKTEQQLAQLQGHRDTITFVAFGPRAASLFTAGGRDSTAKWWNLDRPAGEPQLVSEELQGQFFDPQHVAVSTDGQCLAAGHSDATIRLHEFGPDREFIVPPLATADVTSVAPPKALLSRLDPKALPERFPVTALRWLREERRLISIYAERIVCEIDCSVSPPVRTVLFDELLLDGEPGEQFSRRLRLNPDGRYLIATSYRNQEHHIYVRHIQSKRRVIDFSASVQIAVDPRTFFTHDGRRFVVEGVREQGSSSMFVWDLDTGKQVSVAVDDRDRSDPDTINPDQSRSVRVTNDGRLKIIDTKTGRELLTLTSARRYSWAKFSPDGRRLFVSTQRGIEMFEFDAPRAGKER